MRNIKSLIIIVAIVTLQYSCSPYYSPNMHNVPQFKEKDELKVNLAISSAALSGAEYQVAYSVTDKYAIMFNGYFGETDSYSGSYRNYNEFAFGYYKQLDKYYIFEVYGGAGVGLTTHDFSYSVVDSVNTSTGAEYYKNYDSDIDVMYIKTWIQPSIGLSTDYVEIIFSTRLAILNYSKIKYNEANYSNNYGSEDDISLMQENPYNFLVEPSLTGRIGPKSFKFQVQWGLSLNRTDFRMYQVQDFMNFNIGFHINLSEMFKK